MDHFEIRPGKVKLMLTRDDVNYYRLDTTNEVSEEGLKNLLADVLGRDVQKTDGGRTLVQFYPSRDGSAEIYITRMVLPDFYPKEEQTEVLPWSYQNMTVYYFESLDHLLDACAKVGQSVGKKLFSTAFAVGDTYYLAAGDQRPCPKNDLSGVKCLLSEYGHPAEAQLTVAYLSEHGDCLVPESAIEVLSSLA